MLSLAIRQLLDNALKYSPAGSPVAVSVRGQDDRVLITIEDGGPGIAERDQARIFEKFYRGSNGRSQIPGSGMGLAIARDIVQAHSGQIWVESSLGKGSRFCVALPVETQKEAA